MAVPMMGETGPQGAIMAGRLRGRRGFGSVDLELAEAFANQAAIARELVDARSHQQRLAVLEDRDRIARDLHDHVIQRLFAAGLGVQSVATVTREQQVAARLDRVVEDIDDTIRQIRTSIFQLRGAEGSAGGVRTLVLTVAGQVARLLGFEPEVRFHGPTDTAVPEQVYGDVEAVVREATTNVAKHACASRVSIDLGVEAGVLAVRVEDDGVGLGRPEQLSGLENLRRRAERLAGTMTARSGHRGGTRLEWTVRLPT